MKTRVFEARATGSSRSFIWALVGIFGVLAVTLGGTVFRDRLPARKASVAPVRGSDARTARSNERPIAPAFATSAQDGWQLGERRSYRVAMNLESRGESEESDHAFDLAGQGTLALTAVADDLESIALRGELSDFTATVSSGAAAGQAPEDAMKKPFRVLLTRRGNVESVAIHPELDGSWHALLRAVIATLVFTQPNRAEDDPGHWFAEETDELGRYRAEYTRVRPGAFTKTKGAYTHLDIAPEFLKSGPGPKRSSKTELTVEGRGLVQRADSVGSTSVLLGTTTFTSTTRITLALKSVSVGERPADEPWMTAEAPLYESRGQRPNRENELARKRQLVDGASFDRLATDLHHVKAGSEERWSLLERLTALFDIDPDAVALAKRRLTAGIDPEDAKGLLGALSSATSPEAQTVLTDVAKDPSMQAATRNTALLHLTIGENPTASTVTELAKLAESSTEGEIRDRALFALGGAAGGALDKPETAEVASQAVATLEHGVEQAPDDKSRQLYMNALGNAGAPSSLELLKRQLSDPNPATRSSALQAMRFIPGEEVDRILAQFMLRDPEPLVRNAAVIAAGYRDLALPVAQAAVRLLQTEPLETLRLEVLRALGEKLLLAGQRQVIEVVALSDASPSVKERANALLGRAGE
ncbi:MAG TPA: HEAT repeat domain-containing protein [Polyangiaceae bacterium]